MQLSQPKTPVWYWILAVIAVLWNAIGAFDYAATKLRLDFYMSAFTPEQLEFFYGFPAWYSAVWAIAVWTAFIGSLMLVFRMKLAALTFLISIVSFIVSAIYIYGFTNGLEIMGGFGALIFSGVIFVSLLVFFWLARWASLRGILK